MPYRHIFPIYALWWMEFMTFFLKNTLASQPYSDPLQANCFSMAECNRILLDGLHIRQLSKGFQATIPDGTRVGKLQHRKPTVQLDSFSASMWKIQTKPFLIQTELASSCPWSHYGSCKPCLAEICGLALIYELNTQIFLVKCVIFRS